MPPKGAESVGYPTVFVSTATYPMTLRGGFGA
jgi:hypothetical protein